MRQQTFRYVGGVAVLLAFFALAFVALPAGSASAGGAQLTFDPSSAEIPLGENGFVVIKVANVDNLGGYDVFVQFDPAVVNMTALNDSGFVTGGGNIVVCNDATIDNVAGTGTISCVTIAFFGTPVPGVSTVSAQQMVHASFTGVGEGVSSLTMAASELHDPNGSPIAASVSSGTVSVTGAVGAVGGVTELTERRGEELGGQEVASGGASGFSLFAIVTLAAVGVGAACAGVGVWWLTLARR